MSSNNSQIKGKNLIAQSIYFSLGSIFGPMLFFGVIGYYLDSKMGTNPKYLLIFLGLAFISSNLLLIKKARYFSNLAKDVYIKDAQLKAEEERKQNEEEKKG